MHDELTDAEYQRLLAVRTGLRRFLTWSAERAKEVGLTPMQHQLLLAIRGQDGDPTVGDVAAHLLLRHHSAVELINRAEVAGLVRRATDGDDLRVVRLRLTASGRRKLALLAAQHAAELHRLRGSGASVWDGLESAA